MFEGVFRQDCTGAGSSGPQPNARKVPAGGHGKTPCLRDACAPVPDQMSRPAHRVSSAPYSSHQITPFIGDEAVAIKSPGPFFFGPNAIARNHRHTVAHRMALHRAAATSGWYQGSRHKVLSRSPSDRTGSQPPSAPLPVQFRDTIGPSIFRRRLWYRTLPTRLKAAIAGAEIEFLLITRAVRNMTLAIDAHDLAFRRQSSQRCYSDALPIALERSLHGKRHT